VLLPYRNALESKPSDLETHWNPNLQIWKRIGVQTFRFGNALESKPSDLEVRWTPRNDPNLKVWTPRNNPNLKVWTPRNDPNLKVWTPRNNPNLKVWTPRNNPNLKVWTPRNRQPRRWRVGTRKSGFLCINTLFNLYCQPFLE
jgi:hypothetical protein